MWHSAIAMQAYSNIAHSSETDLQAIEVKNQTVFFSIKSFIAIDNVGHNQQ